MSPEEALVVVYVGPDDRTAADTAHEVGEGREDLDVTGTADVDEAFERVERGDIDCLVSAYELPGIDGIQFLQAVRAVSPDLPFVLYPENGSERIASAAFAANASDYVPRTGSPSTGPDLAARVRAAVRRERSTAEQRARGERATRVLDAAPDAVVVTADGDVVYANPAAVDLFGAADREALLGLDLASLTDADSQRWIGERGEDDRGFVHRLESIPVPGRDRLTVDVTANRIEWDGDAGAVLVLREVAALPDRATELLRSRTQLETVIDTLSAAIFLKDTEGRYLLMNQRCREILGVDNAEDAVGLTDEDLFDGEVATGIWADDRRVLESGETVEIEETVPTPEGERTMLTRKTPICGPDGEPYALCGVSTDITAQTDREHALRERVKELSAIHRAVDLFGSDRHPTAEVLQAFVSGLPDSFQYPDVTEVRVECCGLAATTDGFAPSEHSLTATVELEEGSSVRLEAVRTDEPAGSPFIPEERSLLETLATVVAGYLDRRNYIEELERYETTLRALGDPVYALDAEGRFTFVNDALTERTGYDADRLLGEHSSLVLSPEAVERGSAEISELIADDSRQTTKWELELRTAEGESIPVENHVALLPTEDGEFRGTAGVIRDITERTEREAELKRRQDMLVRTERMADVGGWEYDAAANELYWTEGARAIHEVPEGYEPTLTDAIEFYVPADRETVEAAVDRCLEAGTPFDFEKRLVTAQGRERWVHVRGERVGDGSGRTIRGSIQDITRVRESEQQLMVLNRVLRHNLRNNLNVVTANAELLYDHLSALQPMTDLPADLRKQFPRLIARNLPADSGLDPETVEAAIEPLCEFPADEALEYIERLETNAWELLAISDKSRKLAETIGRAGTVEAVDAVVLLSDLVEEYRSLYAGASITLEADEAAIDGNSAAVRLAVAELLENALKHGGSEPAVTVTVRELSSDRVEIAVADDGPGLPPIERRALEEGEETALKHGSGLGLWTVNWLVSRLGGTVSIDEPDAGTAVRIELPAA